MMRPSCPECRHIVGHADGCTKDIRPLPVREGWALAALIASDPRQAWTA